MPLVVVQARRRRACTTTNGGFGTPVGRAKPAIGFKMRIAALEMTELQQKQFSVWIAVLVSVIPNFGLKLTPSR
jgi:hypothetical protein